MARDEERAHFLGHLAGFDFSHSPHIRPLLDDPQQLSNRARLFFQIWVAQACAIKPAVLALEDLHHADDPTLDLVGELVAAHPRLPLLVVALARPELLDRRPSWGSGHSAYRRIELAPLDRRESRRLAREILQKVDHVPRALRDILVERAEGNPYYLEELVRMLIANRVIVKESDEAWRVEEDRLGHLDVPASLKGLLQARLDGLLEPEKLTLQRAAVIGRVFYDSAVQALDQADDIHVYNLSAILSQLAAQELIYARETSAIAGSTEYVFASGVLREVLLSTLLRRQIELYNLEAAAWLTRASGERVDEYRAVLADYYERAGDSENVALCLRRAGEQALVVSSFGEARALLERALASSSATDPSYPWLQLRLGETFHYLGEYALAVKHLSASLEVGDTSADLAAHAHIWLGVVAMRKGGWDRAEAHPGAGFALGSHSG